MKLIVSKGSKHLNIGNIIERRMHGCGSTARRKEKKLAYHYRQENEVLKQRIALLEQTISNLQKGVL